MVSPGAMVAWFSATARRRARLNFRFMTLVFVFFKLALDRSQGGIAGTGAVSQGEQNVESHIGCGP